MELDLAMFLDRTDIAAVAHGDIGIVAAQKDLLTGAELNRADVDHNQLSGEVQVSLSFKKL